MASGKQYKNVYTILEKVKKGEIAAGSHYKSGDGLFEKLNFYKKPDLIKPHLHYIDESRLTGIVDTYIQDMTNVKEGFDRFKNTVGFKKLDEDKKPDAGAYFEKLRENYKKFPKHMKNDIQKMYYHKMDKLEFEERTDKNVTQFKFLERANNPVGKIMSETSALKSAIYTRNMMMYFLQQITMMEYIDPDAAQQMMNGLNGQGEGNGEGSGNGSDALDQAMKDMFDNRVAKNMLDDAMKDAQDTCKALDESVPKDVQEKMFNEAKKGGGGSEAGKLSPDYLRKVAANLQNINLSVGSLKEKIKKLLDKSVSYFSARKETTYEDLFSSDNLAGLDEFELLHPKLRKMFMEDIVIKDTKMVGKIDVYIDVSGSMSSSCGTLNTEGDRISKLDFSKAFVVKLQQMDMLNEVYVFDTSVKKYRTDPISLAMLDCNGGTTINKAIESIERNNNNALVITDAEDHCSLFSDKAFFIGVEGARFSSFRTEVISQYADRGQVVVFDGTTVLNVDKKGNTIYPDKNRKSRG